jgi:hypothetical protein
MSWGEPQPPPYDPNDPYGQQRPYQQGNQPQQAQPGWTQPYDTGPGYTQPMPDPNNPYGQPQQPYPYGQQQYPQQPYGQPPYGQPDFTAYPAQPPKKGNGAFIAVLVGALVVVGGGIAAAVVLTGNHTSNPVAGPTASVPIADTATATSTGGSSNSTKLSAPASVQGLSLLSNSVAQQEVTSMRSTLSTDTQIYPDPIVAAYNDGGGDNVTTVLIDQAMSDLSASNQSQLTASGSAADVVSETMTGAGVGNAQTEATNANTGALSCGTKQESGSTVTICVWYDQTTFGTLQYLDGTSPSSAAPIADAVRAAAEG